MSALRTGPDGRPLEQRRPFAGPVLAAAIVVGWLAHDLLMFVLSGEPKLFLEAVPRAVVVTGLAAVIGLIMSGFPELLLVLIFGTGAAALALPRVGLGADLTTTDIKLSAALFVLSLALGVGSLLRRQLALGATRTGLSLGAVACTCFWWFQRDLDSPSLLFAVTAAVLLGLGLVRWPLWRLFGTLALAGGFCWLVLVPIVGRFPQVLREPAPPFDALAAGTQSDRPDLLLVVLDTVRASRLAPYGHARTTTPRLDEFAKRHAVRYSNARSTSSWTLPSHASLFTGLMPAQHGATHPRFGSDHELTVDAAALPAQPLRSDVPTLAEILRGEGYRTGAVLANSAYLDPRFGLGRGFEHYDARPGGFLGGKYIPLPQLAGATLRAGHLLYRDAKTITDLALQWLDGDDGRPFFLAINYMDAHSPYLPPPPYNAEFGPEAREPLRLDYRDRPNQYDRALLYLDAQLNRLLRRVDLDRTLIVITSDHGEALGDHGYWMHSWTLYDPVVKVPLYVKPLTKRSKAVEDVPISGAQVFHMILGAMEIEHDVEPATPLPNAGHAAEPAAPSDSIPHLFGEWYQLERTPTATVLADKHVARNLLAWIDEDGRKLIVSSTGEVEAYDLSLDPEEGTPLQLDASERATALKLAEAWWTEHPPPAAAEGAVFDEAYQARLKALGYGDG